MTFPGLVDETFMTPLPTTNIRTTPPAPVGAPRPLLTPLPEPGHFLFVIDNSAAERFICHTLARNYLVEGREPHPTNAALIFGGALHAGIEQILRGPLMVNMGDDHEHPQMELENDDEVLARALRVLTQYFTDHPAPLDEYRTLANAQQILVYYQKRLTFPDYKQDILTDNKGAIIERAFELPLGVLEIGCHIPTLAKHLPEGTPTWVSHIHVAWSGRIDVVTRELGDRICVQDHKTSSQANGKNRTNFLNDFLLSSQTRGYVWAARQLWPEHDIHWFSLDAIQFKRPAEGCGLLDRGPRGGEPALEFFRHYFEYDEASLDSWAEHALTRVEDFLHSLTRGFFPMEPTYCFNRKYGKCPYHEICTLEVSQPKAAMALLHSDAYRKVTWNPTHR